MIIFLIILGILLLIAQVFFVVQLTEVGINLLSNDGGFFVTSNPLAWVVVFILGCIAIGIARFVFRIVNTFIGSIVGNLVGAPFRTDDRFRDAVRNNAIGFIIVFVFWVIATFFITANLMGYFAVNPHLNAWLADGGILAHALTYLALYGIFLPKYDKQEEQKSTF